MKHSPIALLLAVLVLVAVAGCGESGPKLAPVEGTVTLNGEPVPGALVAFQPTDPMASPSYGETDAAGRYVLKFNPQRYGAMLGTHTVSITTENENLKRSEVLPAEYNVKSTLEREVKDENNQFDFAIEIPK